ncbi:MAG: hypothetical protein JO129_03155 [Candidatus Dependentiae bacterium]|nr:hypothetical protein [Candidatus Dependentiae bacterium]
MYTEKQIESVRKQWFFSFIIYSCLSYLPTLIMSSSLIIGIIPCFDLSLKDINMQTWSFEQIIMSKLLLFVLVTWLTYFFAYKTKGIKLLSCIWFIGGLIFVVLQFYTIAWLFKFATYSGIYSCEFAFDTGFIGLQSLINMYYIYYSYQLFRVNKFLLYKDDKS